ncbi:MAG TPA: outer membrane protein assembly factor BamA [Gemmataceae bacterium]|nr:outer membrane protein assembly factor BamA [Gemmataceae bacterium]
MQAKDRSIPRALLPAAGMLALLLALPAPAEPPPLPDVPARLAPGTKLTVGEVKVQGLHNVPPERVLNIAKTKAGAELSQGSIDEDVRTLYATRLFAHVDVRIVEHPENRALVDVWFVVAERPASIQEVVYNGGAHLKLDELKNITHLRKGDPMVPYLNQEACRNIRDELYKQGRPFATVELAEGANPGDTRVVFNITEGPKVKVRDVLFEGNAFVSGGVLNTHVKTSHEFLRLFGGTLNLMLVEYDVEELEKYYKTFGYHDVKVSRELRWVDSNHVDLVFHVSEGARYRVAGRPQVDGAGKQLPAEVVQAIPRVAPGEYYDEVKVKTDIRNITDYYGQTGRDVRVREVPVFDPDTPGVCQVRYELQEKAPSKVGYIYVVGNDVTRQNVILRQMPEGLSPGQTLQYPDLLVAERNLARLGIFETNGETGVRPTVEVLNREGDEEYKDLLVRVQETKTGSLMFGVGVNSDAGLSGSIVMNEKNFDITRFPTSFDDFMAGRAFRGAGQELRIEAVPGTQVQRYSVTWREPFLFDSPYSLTVGAYYYTRSYDEYDESRLGTRFTIGRKLNQYWSVNGSIRIEDVGVHNVPYWDPADYQNADGDNFLVGFRGGVTRDTRDSFLRPTEGSLLDVSFEEVTGRLPNQSPVPVPGSPKSWKAYPSVNVDYNKYWTIWQRPDNSGRHVLAYHGQLAWSGDDTPVFERYFAGGFRSLRGFAFRGVSPQIDGINVGGDFMMLNSLEYQVPVMANDHVWAVAFVDSGTVEPSMEIRDYRVSAGFGVRFVVPMLGPVPIALDFGFPIVKGPGDKEQVFSFWLGFFH